MAVGPGPIEGAEAPAFDDSEGPLFQSTHTGEATDRFDVPPGRYAVELGFAEPAHDAADERVFDARLHGCSVIDDLALAGQLGRFRAVQRPFEVRVAVGERLKLPEGAPLLNALPLTRRP